MLNITRHLRKALAGAERIALLAVGSTLRSDDAAGILVARQLQQLERKGDKSNSEPSSSTVDLSPFLAIFLGQTAPENLTGQIKAYKPSHLLIVDAADMGQRPGHVAVIDADVVGGESFSTHALPLPVLINYLRDSIGCQVILIGIQPAGREFGQAPSAAVLRAAKELAAVLARILAEHVREQ